jgi:hypothetical protein
MITSSADTQLLKKSNTEAQEKSWAFWNMPLSEVDSLGFTSDAAQLLVPITMGFKSIKQDEKSVIVCFVSVRLISYISYLDPTTCYLPRQNNRLRWIL